jgi:hypothetical protein
LGLAGFLRGQAPGIRRVSGFGLVKDFLGPEDLAKLSAVVGEEPKTLGNKPSRFLQDNPKAVSEALGASRSLTLMLVPGLIGAISPLGGKLAAVRAVKGADTLRAVLTKGPKAWLAGFRKLSPAQQVSTTKKLAKEASSLEPAAQRLATRASAVGGKVGTKMAADAKVLRDAARATKATVSTTQRLTAQAPKAAVAAKAARAAAPPSAPATPPIALAGRAGPVATATGKGLGTGRGTFARRALGALKGTPKALGGIAMTVILADMLDQAVTRGFFGSEKGGLIGRAGQLAGLFDPARTRGTKETPEEVQAGVDTLKAIEARDVTQARFQQGVRTGVLKRGLKTVFEAEAEQGLRVSLLGEQQKAIEKLERRLMKFKQAHPDVPTAVAMRVLTKRPPSLSEIINPPDAETEAELTLYDALSQSILAGSPQDGGEATRLLNRANASAPGDSEPGDLR